MKKTNIFYIILITGVLLFFYKALCFSSPMPISYDLFECSDTILIFSSTQTLNVEVPKKKPNRYFTKAFFSFSARTPKEQPNPHDYEFRIGCNRLKLYDCYYLIERENGQEYEGYAAFLQPQKNVELETFYREASDISNQSARLFMSSKYSSITFKYGGSASGLHYSNWAGAAYFGLEWVENSVKAESDLKNRNIVTVLLKRTFKLSNKFSIAPTFEYRHVTESWFWFRVVFEFEMREDK